MDGTDRLLVAATVLCAVVGIGGMILGFARIVGWW